MKLLERLKNYRKHKKSIQRADFSWGGRWLNHLGYCIQEMGVYTMWSTGDKREKQNVYCQEVRVSYSQYKPAVV